MNGVLGRPYRVFYTAKNIQSGLSGIVANVLKPDGSIVGPFNLLEIANSNFSGVYYFDFLTTQLMPEGEYLITVLEGSYKSPVKVSYSLPTDSSESIFDGQKITGTIKVAQRVRGRISNGSILGTIKANRISGSVVSNGIVVGVVRVLRLIAKIEPKKITGKIIC